MKRVLKVIGVTLLLGVILWGTKPFGLNTAQFQTWQLGCILLLLCFLVAIQFLRYLEDK